MRANGYVVTPKKLLSQMELGGSLLASEEVELHPEIAGRVTYLNINEGQFVQQGTLILKINDSDLQAQHQKLLAQKKIAEKNEQRLKELLSINGVGQQEYDAAVMLLNNVNADIEIIKVQIEKTEIKAPFSGKLGLRQISIGAYITSSTLIATLQQINPLKLDFFLPEKYSHLLRLGLKVFFKTESGDTQYSAIVNAIEPRVDKSIRSIQVRAHVDNSKETLLPGSFVKILFNVAELENALLIPSECILPDADGKKVVLSENGIAKFQKVITGFRSNSEVEIIEGLIENDTIATTGLLFIKSGMNLKFTNFNSMTEKKSQK
ncbi:MAG: hypothetical protein A2275_16765 [Bacteroidetes bacterium RIFOXYA12_FULL_35_11]|nr:MAG: hypothetical protein A2X01_03195 [Bacteroidetes bacterium GWF2_35_48]OFY82467.1 MAG: hypothetical protein A2275_16765 [Bacteroidetes bacterium RIFOXYA12_FULL_35_11]OFZ02691.1 MAG: hypothetical protein A2491_06960 [Bacteroidetes bacterium RIFOXYC12_FULL_35_7]